MLVLFPPAPRGGREYTTTCLSSAPLAHTDPANLRVVNKVIDDLRAVREMRRGATGGCLRGSSRSWWCSDTSVTHASIARVRCMAPLRVTSDCRRLIACICFTPLVSATSAMRYVRARRVRLQHRAPTSLRVRAAWPIHYACLCTRLFTHTDPLSVGRSSQPSAHCSSAVTVHRPTRMTAHLPSLWRVPMEGSLRFPLRSSFRSSTRCIHAAKPSSPGCPVTSSCSSDSAPPEPLVSSGPSRLPAMARSARLASLTTPAPTTPSDFS